MSLNHINMTHLADLQLTGSLSGEIKLCVRLLALFVIANYLTELHNSPSPYM